MSPAQQFIDDLSKSDDGKAFIVNAWDCFRGRVATGEFVHGFFHACAVAQAATGGVPLQVVRDVSLSRRADGSRTWMRVSVCSQDPHDAAENEGTTWTTLKRWHDWWHYDLNRSVAEDASFEVPAAPSFETPAEIQAIVDKILTMSGWWQSASSERGAWLGRAPDVGTNCWVSTADLDSKLIVSPSDTSGSALEVQHALGMYYSEGNWLLRYSFPAKAVRALVGDAVARPSFADGGNRRFRVRDPRPRARQYARRRWGCTGHLGAPSRRSDGVGRPERVTEALPVESIAGLRLEALGRIQGVPNEGTAQEILAWLGDGRDPDRLVKLVIMLCA